MLRYKIIAICYTVALYTPPSLAATARHSTTYYTACASEARESRYCIYIRPLKVSKFIDSRALCLKRQEFEILFIASLRQLFTY